MFGVCKYEDGTSVVKRVCSTVFRRRKENGYSLVSGCWMIQPSSHCDLLDRGEEINQGEI
jgi:hypothetical protein